MERSVSSVLTSHVTDVKGPGSEPAQSIKQVPFPSSSSVANNRNTKDDRLLGCCSVVWKTFADVSEVLAASHHHRPD
jgi:hypothetical protein